MSLASLSLITALLMTPTVPQEASTLDSTEGKRIEAAIKATGFSYGRTQDQKAFLVVFSREGETNRNVMIAPTPQEIGPTKNHLIYTTLWRGAASPSEELMRVVLTKIQKYGNPYLLKLEDEYMIRFGVTFDINLVGADPTADDPGVKQLKDTLYFIDAASFAITQEIRKLPASARGEGSQ